MYNLPYIPLTIGNVIKLKEWVAYNYCIAFIDLLGQREEYKDEGFLPLFASEQDREAFSQKIKNSIGPIFALQKDAETMIEAALTPNPERKNTLPPEQFETYNKMLQTKIKRQRWSDGLVFFASLGDSDINCHVSEVFDLLALSGTMCFLGLAKKQPLRGAIDIAWGIELHDGELYGAAVAKAYELESYVAQYPRIVIGKRLIEYLESHRKSEDDDIYSQCDRMFAEMSLNMIMEDNDGYFIVNYLGDSFREYISKDAHSGIHREAISFVQTEYKKYRTKKESKLAFRYSNLLSYFMAHPLNENL